MSVMFGARCKRPVIVLLSCLGLLFAHGSEDVPCGSIPDPFPVERIGNDNGSSARRLKTLSMPPAKWDARDYGWITPVKNQGSYGTCWAFSACSVLETALLKNGYGEFDLSEKNMVLYSGWNATANTGGNITMAGNYLTSWQGPALETDSPYPSSGSSDAAFGKSRMLLPKIKVLGAVRIPVRESPTDNDTVKRALMQYGALVVPYQSCTKSSCYIRNTGACYCNEYINTTSHLVSLVGWDDSYSKDNFARTPPTDGAWIVKNSWGANRDDHGYLHISYHDTTFGFAGEMGAFVLADQDQDYDVLYNYARAGFCQSRGWNNTYDRVAGAAVFTAASDEELAAVGFYALSTDTEYSIQVFVDCKDMPDTGTCVYAGTQGLAPYRGYVTIPLSEGIELKRGMRFSVIVTLRCQSNGYPIAYSASQNWDWITVTAEAKPGQTFYRNVSKNGKWFDFAEQVDSTASFCCAAYVREKHRGASPSDMDNGTTWDAVKLNNWYDGLNVTGSERLQFGKTPGAFAGVRGLNGYSLLENYMLGFDPDCANEQLQLSIRMLGEEPIVEWNRTNNLVSIYTLLGSTDLSSWHKKVNGDRFFKLNVSLP